MSEVKQGIQLYTLRDYIKTAEDFDKTLSILKDEGVSVIQISGIGPIPQETVKEIVEKYSMDVCVTHTNFGNMKTDVEQVIKNHKMINCDCLGIGSMPAEARESLEALRQFIADAEEIGKKMAEQGCHFAYHNHDFELKTKVDGDRTIMDVLLEETNPDYFWFIPDVAWLQIGGVDPVEYLRKMKGRVKVCHFKDYIPKDCERGFVFTELGKGKVDIPACYRACKELSIPYAVYEHDIDWEINAIESCKESYKYMLKVAEENK